MLAHFCRIACCKAHIESHIAAVRPTQLLESPLKRCNPLSRVRTLQGACKYADSPHTLLRLQTPRPLNCRHTEQPDELPTPHSHPQAQGRSAYRVNPLWRKGLTPSGNVAHGSIFDQVQRGFAYRPLPL